MKTISLPINFYGKEFRFNSFWGCLMYKRKNIKSESLTSYKITCNHFKLENVDAVKYPFMMKKRKESHGWDNISHPKIAKWYAKLLTWFSLNCYPMARLCTLFQLNFFENAGDASMFYYKVYPSMKLQQTLCLPRAIFVSTTSRRFKQHGVLFIGTFLPTVRMHAWVVEDGMQADCFDNQWICYQPVMMQL